MARLSGLETGERNSAVNEVFVAAEFNVSVSPCLVRASLRIPGALALVREFSTVVKPAEDVAMVGCCYVDSYVLFLLLNKSRSRLFRGRILESTSSSAVEPLSGKTLKFL